MRKRETMKEKKSVQYYIFVTIIYILVFESLIERKIGIFRYFDEILAMTFIPIIIIHILRNKNNIKIKKYDLIILICLILQAVIGLCANIIYKYQPYYIVLSDLLLSYKFFMVYYASSMYFNKNIFKEEIVKHVKTIIILLFVLTIGNYIFDIWPAEMRFGVKANKLFYSHQTVLTANCVFLLALIVRTEKKTINPYSIAILLMLISTLRFKAIGLGVLFLIISVYVKITNKKIHFYKFAVIALIVMMLSYQQIKYYFVTVDNSARSMLLKTSFEIANDYFPLGTGFGTYGSYFSGVNYSPVYYIYNLQDIQGLQKKNPDFISDSFWPMIIGQFGYLGTILYMIAIIMIFRKIQDNYDIDNKEIYISKLICLSYLLISSTAESAFVHPMAIPLAILLGI